MGSQGFELPARNGGQEARVVQRGEREVQEYDQLILPNDAPHVRKARLRCNMLLRVLLRLAARALVQQRRGGTPAAGALASYYVLRDRQGHQQPVARDAHEHREERHDEVQAGGIGDVARQQQLRRVPVHDGHESAEADADLKVLLHPGRILRAEGQQRRVQEACGDRAQADEAHKHAVHDLLGLVHPTESKDGRQASELAAEAPVDPRRQHEGF
mmetsp:Transcript_51103/g.100956  ORF Transcript_51103/g.100956 Transcript_51103/m.100956 type:complete len:215 (+) Transcript_51103:366-1010(+)